MVRSAASPASPNSTGSLRRRTQLSEDVAVHVRNLIMSGQTRPGEFIRLDETAAELGVSVTPVREALLTLRGEGLVELVPHRGYVVAPLSRNDVNDLFWLQGQIAVELAIRAADHIDDGVVSELEEINDELQRAVDLGDTKRVEELEFDFHRVLNRLAGARKLSWFLLGATRYTPANFYSSDRAWGDNAVANHTRLIKALAAGDSAAIAAETRAHFDDGAKRLVQHLESIGIWS
ncbi:GntR family transcriptional regulator [Rhodococcus spongiicola]|uniref:GntR family transcriptional regulator n=1 Tax=Rhodococcus spongiicola TaxID=2487352 RepID=A0A3S3ABV0_9NOCA|nr:GntR family transcriptional regulator [Rhodococcus spongiicola]RVW04383.1 GntR family transcriptional regulator [Rhodococcus spongiicola]